MNRGASGCEEISPMLIKAYGEWDPSTQSSLLEWISGLGMNITASISKIEEVNWVAQCPELTEELVAGQFRVLPQTIPGYAAGVPKTGVYNLLINLGHGFGTGHHTTTRSLLSLLSDFAITANHKKREIKTVVDIGTGSGILAIAAALVFPSAKVLALDNDAAAIENARSNLLANAISAERVSLATADIATLKGVFDLIFANIYAEVLAAQASVLGAIAQPGSMAMLSGVTSDKLNQVLDAYLPNWFEQQRIAEDGWCSLLLEKK
jgi:ribosomal protein L11 methyltransferase